MRKLIFTLAILLVVTTTYARECSDDVINACYDLGVMTYSNCMNLGNSDTNCTALRNKITSDCYRINNCLIY